MKDRTLIRSVALLVLSTSLAHAVTGSSPPSETPIEDPSLRESVLKSDDLLGYVLDFLSPTDRTRCARVDKAFRAVAIDPVLSQIVRERTFDPIIQDYFVEVSESTFLMGDADEPDATPHWVTVSAHEQQEGLMTRKQYRKLMDADPEGVAREHDSIRANWMAPSNENLPVTYVSWYDAQKVVQAANAKAGEGHKYAYRLPTEAEQELVRRGVNEDGFVTTTRYPWGDEAIVNGLDWLGKHAWYKANSEGILPILQPVKQKEPIRGLYDTLGNVLEWGQDRYGAYPQAHNQANAIKDPQWPDVGPGRVLRGGAFYRHAWYCRSAYRSYDYPDSRRGGIGLRLVRTIIK